MVSFAALTNNAMLVSTLTAVAVAAGVFVAAMPFLDRADARQRMKSVTLERDRIRARARERERMGKEGAAKPILHSSPGEQAKQFVEQLSLDKWLNFEEATEKLMRAGLRGPKAETTFLIARLMLLIGFFMIGLLLVLLHPSISTMGGGVKMMVLVILTFIGLKAPEIYLSNITKKRQASIRKAFPEALDLLLICVETGLSVESGFAKVAQEIGANSLALAEELTLVTAELSYLPDRRQAYENLAKRTDVESVRSVSTALIQAERYGTPLGQALRVLAQESRDQRMSEAEKKAAALPPKLTVPMILFFMPALFIVILTPSLVRIFKWE